MDHLFTESTPFNRPDAFNQARATASTKVVDEFSRILISTTLLRMVWDHRESMRGPRLPPPRGRSPDIDVSSDKVKTLICLLDELTTNSLSVVVKRAYIGGSGYANALPNIIPSAPLCHTEREFQGLVHRARVSLVAQIVAADEISDHLDAGWSRHSAEQKYTVHEVAERGLRAWADKDPVRPRRMARVGAQLLAISRLYPYNMPREPYDAFRAGLLLWTMLPLVRSTGASHLISWTPTRVSSHDEPATMVHMSADSLAPDSRCSTAYTAIQHRQRSWNGSIEDEHARRVCQLDWLGAEDCDEAQTIRHWVQRGGDEFVLRVEGITNVCTQHGSRQILQQTSDLLGKLHVWGSSNMYREIIERALRDADGN